MLDFSEYRGQEIIVCCRTREQVDLLCGCIDIDKPGTNSINTFYQIAERESGGVGLRLYVTHSGKGVAWRGYSHAGFYKRSPEYHCTPILEFEDLECSGELFQVPEISF